MDKDQLTQLIKDSASGNRDATNKLFPLIYNELKRIARGYMRKEAANHTLQPTALVHEAFFRLAQQESTNWQDRQHFFCIAANLMRRILVDHARAKHAAKRGGEARPVTLLDDIADTSAIDYEELQSLDFALEELAKVSERQARIVELRYFAGMGIEETAAAMAISPATVKREWSVARAWLHRKMEETRGEL